MPMRFNLILCFALFVQIIHAQAPIKVTSSLQEYFVLSKHLAVLEDSSNTLTIEQIITGQHDDAFEIHDKVIPNTKHVESTYWTKIILEGSALKDKEWFIEALVSLNNNIQFFCVTDKGLIKQSNVSGTDHPFAQKEIAHKNFLYRLPQVERQVIYFKTKTSIPVHLVYKLWESNNLIEYALSEYYYLALFYGVLFVMGLCNLVLFLFLKQRIYLYFLLYIAACFFLFSTEDGLAFHFFWSDYPFFNKITLNASPIAFLLSFTIYFMSYFEVNKYHPSIAKSFIGIVTISILYNLVELFVFKLPINITLYIVPFFLFYAYSIYRSIQPNRFAQYFLFAFTFTFTGIILLILRKHMLLDIDWSRIIFVYSLNIAVLIELITLFFIQAMKWRYEEIKKREAIQTINQQLNKKNLALEKTIRSNTELESFAAVISHDLRQPLRSITSFAQILSRRLIKENRLKDKEVEMFDFIKDSAKNMDTLILELLEYAKVDQHAPIKQVMLSDLVNLCKQNLHQVIQENNATIQTNGLDFEIKAVRAKIIQLFQNLLANAIKFRKEDIPPIIQINAYKKEKQSVIEIIDNGMGIETKHLDKIFDVMYKIHASNQVTGYGIGLATCKKIVEQHDGIINVYSEVGKGTTFIIEFPFTLSPSNPNNVLTNNAI